MKLYRRRVILKIKCQGKKDIIHLQDLESHVRDEDENSKYKPLPLDKIFLTGKKWFQNELDKIFI